MVAAALVAVAAQAPAQRRARVPRRVPVLLDRVRVLAPVPLQRVVLRVVRAPLPVAVRPVVRVPQVLVPPVRAPVVAVELRPSRRWS